MRLRFHGAARRGHHLRKVLRLLHSTTNMNYAVRVGIWHVGPFTTHTCAQHWAESHGVDDYQLVVLDDPAEAPARIARMVREQSPQAA